MPIYEYECRKCGVFEYSQSICDDPLKRCPRCRSAVQKLLSASAFHLKGGGWYSDGYDKKSAGEGAGAKPAEAGSSGDAGAAQTANGAKSGSKKKASKKGGTDAKTA